MANVNKAILVGRLGKDAEKRVTNSGREVLVFSIATTRTWKDPDGKRQEHTEWHEIAHWARRQGGVDGLREYLVKGREVYIEGELRTRTYDKDGQQHKRTEINAFKVELTGSRRDSGNGGGGRAREDRGDGHGYQPHGGHRQEDPPPTDIDIDDIPF